MPWVFFVLVLGGVAFYFTTPDERARFFRSVRDWLRGARHAAAERRTASAAFYDALGERSSIAFVTLVLVGINLLVFIAMAFGRDALHDPATLVAWGGNYGPRTTNGEWWRLISAAFVQPGVFALLVTLLGLFQAGMLVERLVGHIAFAVTYVAAAVFAGLVSVAVAPVAAHAGAVGPVFGVYGLLLASVFWGTVRRSAATIPWRELKTLLPAVAVFGLYAVATGIPGGWVELTGVLTGLSCGIVLARRVSEEKATARRVASVMSATMVAALVATVPLSGMTDARPEVDRVIAAEQRMAGEYQAAVVRFNQNRLPASDLTRLIDRRFVPEIQRSRARLRALTKVPQLHQPMVATTEEYLRLREESWRLRSEALRKASVPILKDADRTEWASLVVFRRIKPGGANGA